MKQPHLFLLALVLAGCARQAPTPAEFLGNTRAPALLPDLPPQVHSFIERKEQDALALANKLGVKPDAPTLQYFQLARQGEYRAASRIYQDLRERGGKVESPQHEPGLSLPLWDPLLEVQLALDAYAAHAGQFATAFGEGIAQSLPRGSIYFGGTDTGRGLPAAFARPRDGEESFFVLTQNQLADGQHINYLRATYGDRIYIPSNEDSQQCFQAYLDDAMRRFQHDQRFPEQPRQIRPGESVAMVAGRPQVSGQVAVMMVNGLLSKVVFDKNPGREFYVEESFPLDWMYPHLAPHGLIMKIHREPLQALSPELVAGDHAFWSRQQARFIGAWLTPDTPVKAVCAFAEKVFLEKDLGGFDGDPEFVRNHYASASYSKLRVAQAGVYVWRSAHSKSPDEQQRMIREADLAFRQSFALDPTSSESLFGYVNLLLSLGRIDDALHVARTARKLRPHERPRENLIQDLERLQREQPKSR